MSTSTNVQDKTDGSLRVHRLRCEYAVNPLGIDAPRPRLSWVLDAARRGVRQSAYQVRVTEEESELWDSGKVTSDRSIHVPYGGPALRSGQRCAWQVRVWDEADRASEWSESAWWEMGLLHEDDWQAEWITPDWDEDTTQSQPAPMLRRVFKLEGDIQAARIYATSLGLYELHLNGQRVGDGQLTPGWTPYDRRLQVQTYDVTGLLVEGDNALGAMLADGWYRGWLGFEGNRNTYGDRLALLMQLVVTYANGRQQVIAGADAWRAATGPIQMADLYNGESYDARLERPGWASPGYDDGDWRRVRRLERGKETLVAQSGPYVKRQEEIQPVEILRTPAGETVYDFGQNMVGWVRLRVKGPAGTTVTLRHAEVLDQEGNLYTTNLRTADQIVRYTLRGGDDAETYEPRFTFMGFRYVAVEGWPGEPDLEDLTGVVVHSDIPSTGTFECSNPMLNQLQHNIVWGQKGNFVDVPTDCPQRDERLGWTGDAQVFIRTACFNRDMAGFFTKWLRDLAVEQYDNGAVPMVIPDPMRHTLEGRVGFTANGSAAWADAATICPWTIYLCYGDRQILEAQYDSMKSWVGYMRAQAGDDYLWASGFHFGDWLDYRGSNPMQPAPITDKELIATAFYAYSTRLTQQAAEVLGKTEDARAYAELVDKVVAAFNAEFVSPNGRVGSNSQTSYVLALHFDLLPEAVRPKAAARLAGEVRKFGDHLTTGFVGTPYLCHVLSRFGYTDLAYELLNQESYPSWLYPVKKGATTIWERWDGIKPDGSFQDEGMNSFNHYAYGAIGDWMYRVVAGIDADAGNPGYKHALIQPQPGGGLTRARATLDSPYGAIVSDWELTEDGFCLRVTVPPNARATVRIPASELGQVTESGGPLDQAAGVVSARFAGNAVVVEVGSGEYEFYSLGLNRAQAMETVRHVAGRLDVYCSLGDLLADERARAILVEHFGGEALESPHLERMLDQPLGALARFAPQMLTPERMVAVQQALLAL